MENVLSWEEGLKSGFEPREYPYKDAIIGEINVMMDFKIWAKESVAVVCYFMDIESGKKFQLSVFRLKNGEYKLKDGEIDFRICPTGEEYQLVIEKNTKGNPFMKECLLITNR